MKEQTTCAEASCESVPWHRDEDNSNRRDFDEDAFLGRKSSRGEGLWEVQYIVNHGEYTGDCDGELDIEKERGAGDKERREGEGQGERSGGKQQQTDGQAGRPADIY